MIEVQKKILEKVADDPVKSARLFKLVYVSGQEPGITREKHGKKFRYFLNGKKLNDEEVLARVQKLAIPPAWKHVWICKNENGHLQATGTDVKLRKQYRYHTLWNKMRSETKYFRLHEFGKRLPDIRKQLQKDISSPGFTLNKILATIVLIMERTSMRIGNSFYEKLYGSFGLTTLKNRHVNVKGNNIRFEFNGKKGIRHTISLRSKRLSSIVKKCLDIPGKELFQFYDEEGTIHRVDSGMVNDYIHQLSGEEFSSKDLRTWSGTILALTACKERMNQQNEKGITSKTTDVIDEVAKHLGNTRAVCRKYYIHPVIIELYEAGQLGKYFSKPEKISADDTSGYNREEKILMKILEGNSRTSKVIEVSTDEK